MNIDQIAQVCHEANRAYCASLGDNSQLAWDDAPEWQKSSARSGVRLHLETLERGDEPLPRASHEAWLKQKQAEGWVYGPTKSTSTKEHPCLVPFDELPPEQRMKDFIFVAIVKAFWLGQAKARSAFAGEE